MERETPSGLDNVEREPSASQPRRLISTLACPDVRRGVAFNPSRRGIRIPGNHFYGRQ
jgi:hypothetical protein